MAAIVVLTSSPSAALASAESAVVGFGPGFIHIQSAAAELLPVQGLNGLLCFSAVAHLHKAKAARAPGLAVSHHGHAFNVAVGCEKRLQICLSRIKREVTNEKFHVRILCKFKKSRLFSGRNRQAAKASSLSKSRNKQYNDF